MTTLLSHQGLERAAVSAELGGLNVLVVEDNAMIGMDIEDMLLSAGCRVCGPHISFEAGLHAAAAESVDIAVLDVNLGGGTLSYPIGEALQARGIPFVLVSGYGHQAAPPEQPNWPTCCKPFTTRSLTSALAAALR